MKTLSDFFGKNLRALEEQMPKISQDAAQAAEEAMKAEGKSKEEINAALPEAVQAAVIVKLGELTKFEGDKVVWLKNALSLIQGKKGNLKRVVVMEAAEGEKSTQDAKLVDGKYFAVEFYQEAARAAPQDSRGGRFGDKRGGSRGRDGKGGERGRGGAPSGDRDRGGAPGGRPPRGPSAGPRPALAGGDAPRENRPPRPRREPVPAIAPGTGKTSPLIILSGASKAPAPQAEAATPEKTTPEA